MALRVVRPELSPAELVARLRAGDSEPLTELYRLHRGAFLDWARRRYPTLTDDDLADAFQEAIVRFYENISSGHLTTLSASPKTLIFLIGDRQCVRVRKNNARTVNISTPSGIKGMEFLESHDLPAAVGAPDELLDDPFELADTIAADSIRAEVVARALRQLSPDCHRLLTAFYYEGQSLADLTAAHNYRDTYVAAARKSQCLARLRTLCGSTS